ncbi:LOW QUALITY PROTEIN: organic anion transporter 7-like [Dugong dugon]
MGFHNLLDQVGGQGRFHIFQMAFLLISNVIVHTHIVLENFTTAITGHRCCVHNLNNNTVSINGTGILSPDALLRISIPLDSNLKPEECHHFLHLQWQLLHLNGTFLSITKPNTEPCVDGWVYDKSTFTSTIVTKAVAPISAMMPECTKVAQIPANKPLHYLGKIFTTSYYCTTISLVSLFSVFGRRLILRWCFLRSAIANTCAAFAPTFLIYCSLHFLAGFSSMAIFINTDMLKLSLPKFQAMGMTLVACSYSIGQITLGGLAFAFREWRILQLVLSVPLFVFFLASRWLAESARWLIVNNKPEEGLKELARINGIKNAGETLTVETLNVILAILGMGAASAINTCSSVHTNELFPTSIRARTSGIGLMANSSGAALAPLLMTLVVYSASLLWIIYGVAPILASLAVLLLPETRNRPLLDTIQDVENERKGSRKAKEDTYMKVTQF